jgi:hypothetical protein
VGPRSGSRGSGSHGRVGPGVGPGSGSGSGSRSGSSGSGSGSKSGSKSGSWSGSKSGSQSQSWWLLERLDGSDAAWLSHQSRLMHLPCKDSCCCQGWHGRSGDCLGWHGVVPGGSAGGSLGKDSPMTSWLGVTTEVLNHLSRVG